jgi:hypothetical protein
VAPPANDDASLVVPLGDELAEGQAVPLTSKLAHTEANNLMGLFEPFFRFCSDQSAKPFAPTRIQFVAARRGAVYIIPGTSRHDILENHMNEHDLTMPWTPARLGYFRYMMRTIAASIRADVVLVDLGPANSWMNQIFVTSCDYVLPCLDTSAHSVTSLHMMMTTVFPKWMKLHVTMRHYNAHMVKRGDQNHLLYNDRAPRILPCLITNYLLNDTKQVDTVPAGIIRAMSKTLNITHGPAIPASIRALWHPLTSDDAMIIPFFPRGKIGGFLGRRIALPSRVGARMLRLGRLLCGLKAHLLAPQSSSSAAFHHAHEAKAAGKENGAVTTASASSSASGAGSKRKVPSTAAAAVTASTSTSSSAKKAR